VNFRLGVLIGGLGVAVVALVVVLIVLLVDGPTDSTTSATTGLSEDRGGNTNQRSSDGPDCGVVEAGGPARLDLTQSGLNCEEGRAIQLALITKAQTSAPGVIRVGAWVCSREPFSEYPILTRCRSDNGRELIVVGTAHSAHVSPAEEEAAKTSESASADRGSPIAFETPSGNITCALSRSRVSCEISRKTYTPYIPKPPSCHLDYGHRVSVGAYGPAEFDCYGDSMHGIAEGTLAYGREIRRGRIGCLSAEAGLTCETASGAGFFLSVASVKLL
jgi:hypothetical protein